jgi:hypothetical protein
MFIATLSCGLLYSPDAIHGCSGISILRLVGDASVGHPC